MCSCDRWMTCAQCVNSDHRDYLIEWEPDARELEELARYNMAREHVDDEGITRRAK